MVNGTWSDGKIENEESYFFKCKLAELIALMHL
jgi:hypothetical protein